MPLASQVDLKPASDVLAGAMARAASQSTIHPLDTLKVRCRPYRASSIAVLPLFTCSNIVWRRLHDFQFYG